MCGCVWCKHVLWSNVWFWTAPVLQRRTQWPTLLPATETASTCLCVSTQLTFWCCCLYRLAALKQQLAAAKQEAGKAQSWHRSYEASRMEVEDLRAANNRAMLRRHELVASYWPVMSRLNTAEDAVAALTQQLAGLGQEPVLQLPPRDSRAREVEGLEPHAGNTTTTSSSGEQAPGQQQSAGQESCCSRGKQQPAAATQQHEQSASGHGDAGAAAGPGTAAAAALEGLVHGALQEELAQLRSSYLLLQEEYWKQKERLMALDLDCARLTAAASKAADTANQVGGLSVCWCSAAASTSCMTRGRACVLWFWGGDELPDSMHMRLCVGIAGHSRATASTAASSQGGSREGQAGS